VLFRSGGGTVICPGVRIGARAVIGAGSVVTRDIPADVVAAGNPCRVIRTLKTPEDLPGCNVG
jgi:maltose O-acetyltransferase